jgi:hypothetical protein
LAGGVTAKTADGVLDVAAPVVAAGGAAADAEDVLDVVESAVADVGTGAVTVAAGGPDVDGMTAGAAEACSSTSAVPTAFSCSSHAFNAAEVAAPAKRMMRAAAARRT